MFRMCFVCVCVGVCFVAVQCSFVACVIYSVLHVSCVHRFACVMCILVTCVMRLCVAYVMCLFCFACVLCLMLRTFCMRYVSMVCMCSVSTFYMCDVSLFAGLMFLCVA